MPFPASGDLGYRWLVLSSETSTDEMATWTRVIHWSALALAACLVIAGILFALVEFGAIEGPVRLAEPRTSTRPSSGTSSPTSGSFFRTRSPVPSCTRSGSSPSGPSAWG